MMKSFFRRLLCSLGLLVALGSGILQARDVLVENPEELKAAIGRARAGDILILKKGEWRDAAIVVDKGGRAKSPVVLRAEVPGETILCGASSIEINAPYVTVDGLFFRDGATTGQAVILFNSDHGVVSNTAIVDYNPPSFETECYWVFFNGDSNELDHCYFKGKNNRQPLIGNAIEDSRHHRVTRCYFKDIPYAAANGREIIRVWGAGKFGPDDKDGAFFTIAENLFDHADGEGTEIISLKSNYNTVINNTVVASRGCLNIRRGNFNTVQGNIILGEGILGAQGLRMSGEKNLVQGNYVSGCEYGIQVSTGEYMNAALSNDYTPNIKGKSGAAQEPVATYPQNREVTISDNVTVGISGADLEIGSGYKKHWPEAQLVLIPEDCIIKNNRFVRPDGGESVIGTTPEKTGPLAKLKFKPNKFMGNVLVGGTNAYPPASSGFRSQHLPHGWTEARERAALKPLTADDVGPDWIIAQRRAGKLLMESSSVPTSVGTRRETTPGGT
jgi:poly(beta-D-mannuronate) lyase